jgi:hypothetical protein
LKKELYISKVHDDGTLQKNVSKQIRQQLLSLVGQSVIIEISKKRKQRSVVQNGYYWGVVVQFFKDGALDMWGEHLDSEQCHEYLKTNCNYKELINTNTGEVTKMPQSTKDTNTLEFEEYLDRCRKFIYEYFNIVVPLPNEQAELL